MYKYTLLYIVTQWSQWAVDVVQNCAYRVAVVIS